MGGASKFTFAEAIHLGEWMSFHPGFAWTKQVFGVKLTSWLIGITEFSIAGGLLYRKTRYYALFLALGMFLSTFSFAFFVERHHTSPFFFIKDLSFVAAIITILRTNLNAQKQSNV